MLAILLAVPSTSCSAMQTLTLRSSKDQMPVVGLGLWKVPRETTADAVVDAIKAGYRHFDCACDYGNEAEVGAGLRRAIAEGLVTREQLWVTTKLWNTYHAPEHVLPALRRSLSDLGLEYVDLFLMHFPLAQRFVPFEVRYPPEWVYDPDAPTPTVELAPALLRDLLASATQPPSVLQAAPHAVGCVAETSSRRHRARYLSTPPLRIPRAPFFVTSARGFELAPDDLAAIATLDRGKRFNDPGVFSEGMNAFLPIYD
ncbi:hypothetical protein EMIHUDRAFT_464332 [Emiliania huxleyi CCMP1516]|uniref:NADP-dependent oxidoreductase domain-containing protein n=2 Tax=Emiliania huxleyi TaxID=2903 RepID=A0A0D3IYN0_EMIH1|nr:hypothetical protein EMIHUDRAFT_464332 [Emiliania huxleyi CCMP1516]EOD16365.1 hypothetical protein EMIHUDRAFT_464332 [Emiliania huxleyi CCMP1516]|eukprot:XP_005768794.1 hypothetical protein EMIHUDRAFT_464332 [Emiliania huxleyi CCMP1516]